MQMIKAALFGSLVGFLAMIISFFVFLKVAVFLFVPAMIVSVMVGAIVATRAANRSTQKAWIAGLGSVVPIVLYFLLVSYYIFPPLTLAHLYGTLLVIGSGAVGTGLAQRHSVTSHAEN